MEQKISKVEQPPIGRDFGDLYIRNPRDIEQQPKKQEIIVARTESVIDVMNA